MTPRDLVDQKKINQYRVEFAQLAAVRVRRFQLLTNVYSEENGVDPAPITDMPIEMFDHVAGLWRDESLILLCLREAVQDYAPQHPVRVTIENLTSPSGGDQAAKAAARRLRQGGALAVRDAPAFEQVFGLYSILPELCVTATKYLQEDNAADPSCKVARQIKALSFIRPQTGMVTVIGPLQDVERLIYEGRISGRKLDHTRIYTAIYDLVTQTMQISTTTSRRPGDDLNGWNQMARELTKAYKAMGYDKTFTGGDVDRLIDRLDAFTMQEAETFDEALTGGAAYESEINQYSGSAPSDEDEINQYSGSAPSRQGDRAPDSTATPGKCQMPNCKGFCGNRTSCYLCHTPAEGTWCCVNCHKVVPGRYDQCSKPVRPSKPSKPVKGGCVGKKADSLAATTDDVLKEKETKSRSWTREHRPPAQRSGN